MLGVRQVVVQEVSRLQVLDCLQAGQAVDRVVQLWVSGCVWLQILVSVGQEVI